jgi:hypothetical protein
MQEFNIGSGGSRVIFGPGWVRIVFTVSFALIGLRLYILCYIDQLPSAPPYISVWT